MRKLINAVIKDLHDNPHKWTYNGFRLSRDGVSIWLANGHYGMDINGFGGVTMASTLLGPLIPWRFRLRRAAMAAIAAKATAKFSSN